MKKQMMTVALTALLMGLTGCSTMFGDNDRLVHVNSVPKGAQVKVNNQVTADTTPTQVVVKDMFSPTTITVAKKGCKSQTTVIEPEFQKIGLLNILIFPGFIVDAITGDMMKVPDHQKTLDLTLCH